MDRINLTLDADTSSALARHAKRHKRPRAALARELIREALQGRDQKERAERLARDYLADRNDVAGLLTELEGAQLELLGEDG